MSAVSGRAHAFDAPAGFAEPEDDGVGGLVVLGREECLQLLATRAVGRVAVSMGAIPAIFPVNYCMLDDSIVFLTATGTKLDAATRHAVIAFEVDDFDTMYHVGWSVLVVGMAEELTSPALLERAARLPIRPWAPGARHHVVEVHPQQVSGRRIELGGGPRPLGS